MKPPNPDWRILKDTDLKEPSQEEAIMFPEEIVVEDGQQVLCADGHWRPASNFSKDDKLSAYNVETGETAPVKRITKETK